MKSGKYSFLALVTLVICLLPTSRALSDCSCTPHAEPVDGQPFSPAFNDAPLSKGYVVLRGSVQPKNIRSLDICMWRKGDEDEGAQVLDHRIYDHPVNASRTPLEENAYEFDLEQLRVHGSVDLEARPRILNYRIKSVEADNRCVGTSNACSLVFDIWLKKTWDVQVEPVADEFRMRVDLINSKVAQHIAPEEQCPLSHARGSYIATEADVFTFKVEKKQQSLKLKVVRIEGNEEKASLSLTVKQRHFNADNEWTEASSIRARIEKKHKTYQGKRAGSKSRQALSSDLSDWGISANPGPDPEEGPRVIIVRLP